MLRKEGELAVKMVVASRSSSLKRKAAVSGPSSSSNDSMKEQASTSTQGSDECDSSRGHKRRRLASSLFEGHHDDAMHLRLEDADTNAMAILKDMKLKMDRQAQTLEALTQENNQVYLPLFSSCAPLTVYCLPFSFYSLRHHSANSLTVPRQPSLPIPPHLSSPVLLTLSTNKAMIHKHRRVSVYRSPDLCFPVSSSLSHRYPTPYNVAIRSHFASFSDHRYIRPAIHRTLLHLPFILIPLFRLRVLSLFQIEVISKCIIFVPSRL